MAPSFVPYADVVSSDDADRGTRSVFGIGAVGLGLILALLAIVTSAGFWSEAVHSLDAGRFLAWMSRHGAAGAGEPGPGPAAPLHVSTADSATDPGSTELFSEGGDQPADPRTAQSSPVALTARQSISMTASASALLSPTYSSTVALPPVPAPSITQPSPTPIPPSPTPTPELLLPRPTPTPATGPPPADSPPTRLTIPRVGLDVRVRPVGYTIKETVGETIARWNTRRNAASFHNTSALPGHPGNTVINGHRDIFGAVFYDLDKVRVGDQIILFVGEEAYRYEVTETRIVRYVRASPEKQAEHLRLMGSFPDERLTLLTCTPIGLATHRLYVIAKPASGEDAVPLG